MASIGDSQYGGVVRFDEADFDNDEAVDAQLARVLINNAQHLSAEDAQVRVAWAPLFGVSIAPGTITDITEIARFGPFPVRRTGPRNAAKLRVRVSARLATASATGTLYLVFSRSIDAGLAIAFESSCVLKADLASTTWSWVTTKTLAGTAETLIEVPYKQMPSMRTTTETITEVGGDATHVSSMQGYLTVWFQGLTGTAQPEISGLYAAEWLG